MEDKIITCIRPSNDKDPIQYAYQVCASDDDGSIPIYYNFNAHVQFGEESVSRLIDAIEGECEGLAISEEQALSILNYVVTGKDAALKNAAPALLKALSDLTNECIRQGIKMGPLIADAQDAMLLAEGK